MVEHLRKLFDLSPRPAVLYVHCDYKERARQGVDRLLSGLVKQAVIQLQHAGGMPDEVIDIYKEHAHGETPLTVYELRGLLIKLLQRFRRSFLLVDALDEYVPSEGDADLLESVEIFDEVREVMFACSGSCRVFVTSRDPSLNSYKETFATRVEVVAMDIDVRSYVDCYIRSDQFPRKYKEKVLKDPAFDRLIVDSLTEKARGQ